MGAIIYEFVHLDSDASFTKLGRTFGGMLQQNTLTFDNDLVKGAVTKWEPEAGLWVRKWSLTTFQQIVLHKIKDEESPEKKYSLVYLLDPSLFQLKKNTRKVRLTGHHNSLFFSGNLTMDFSVIPKHPFYCLDIAFTHSWIMQQFQDADEAFRTLLQDYLERSCHTVLPEPCCIEEYKSLHEVERFQQGKEEDLLFIRSRIYGLIVHFFCKLIHRESDDLVRNAVHYKQMMEVEKMIGDDILNTPKVELLSRHANMSVSSLLRQFKLIYKKSIQEYCVEKKMDLAKVLLLKSRVSVKDMARLLGYRQVSSFIETFTKKHGYTPGRLRS